MDSVVISRRLRFGSNAPSTCDTKMRSSTTASRRAHRPDSERAYALALSILVVGRLGVAIWTLQRQIVTPFVLMVTIIVMKLEH